MASVGLDDGWRFALLETHVTGSVKNSALHDLCLLPIRLAAHQSVVGFRITRPLDLDLRGGAFDGLEIFRREFDVECSQVFFKTI